jgi:hypothetical protein
MAIEQVPWRTSAPHSVLLMWVVGSQMADAIDLGRAWGFTYKTDVFYWLKQKMIDADQIDIFTGDIAAPRISMGLLFAKAGRTCVVVYQRQGRSPPFQRGAAGDH